MDKIVDSKHIIQINLVVDDVERVARNYCDAFGMEMPEIWEHPGPDQAAFEYKGKFEKIGKVKICVLRFGDLALELTQVVDAEDTSWKDFQNRYGYGVHNIGLYVDDLDMALAAFAKKGAPAIHTGYFTEESYTIVESEKAFGCRFNVKHAGEDNRKLIAEHRENGGK